MSLERINISGGERGAVLHVPLWHRCPRADRDNPPGWLWPAQLQVLTFGVPGADRIPDTLELPRRASFAASPTGLGVRFSFVASGISASLWLFLCLSCFTWPGGLGFSDF